MRNHTLALLTLLGSSSAFGANLLEVYEQALTQDPQYLAADAARLAAGEALPQSRATFLPAVNLSAAASEHRQDVKKSTFGATGDRSFSNNGYTLSLTQPLFHYDTYVQRRQARERVSQAEIDYAAAGQALTLRVAEAYFNLLSATDNLEFARAEKSAIARQLEQTRQRFNVGMATITDTNEAQARYDLAVAQEISADNQLASAREALREVTGQYHPRLATLGADIPLVSPDPADGDKWAARALEQNPGLISARHATEQAREEIARRRAGYYPALDLTAGHTYQDNGGSFSQESTDSSVGLQLSWNLYQGGSTDSRVREASYQHLQTRQRGEQVRRGVESQARNAYLGVLAGIARVNALKQAQVSSQSALDATEAGLEVGTRTTVDVLNARRDLYRAQRDYAQSRYDYLLNTLRLKQAAGILAATDLEQINAWLK